MLQTFVTRFGAILEMTDQGQPMMKTMFVPVLLFHPPGIKTQCRFQDRQTIRN